MFASDHPPPHFHIWTTEGEVMISLETLTVLKGGGIRKQDLALALDWATQNIGFLKERWIALNGNQ